MRQRSKDWCKTVVKVLLSPKHTNAMLGPTIPRACTCACLHGQTRTVAARRSMRVDARTHAHEQLDVYLHCEHSPAALCSMKICISCKIRNIVYKKRIKKTKRKEYTGKEDIDEIYINFLHLCFVYLLITFSFFITWKFSSKSPLHWYLNQIDCIYRGFYQKCTHWNYEILCFKGIRWRAKFWS